MNHNEWQENTHSHWWSAEKKFWIRKFNTAYKVAGKEGFKISRIHTAHITRPLLPFLSVVGFLARQCSSFTRNLLHVDAYTYTRIILRIFCLATLLLLLFHPPPPYPSPLPLSSSHSICFVLHSFRSAFVLFTDFLPLAATALSNVHWRGSLLFFVLFSPAHNSALSKCYFKNYCSACNIFVLITLNSQWVCSHCLTFLQL